MANRQTRKQTTQTTGMPQMPVLLLDKPKGPTSFEVVERVAKRLNVSKAGHSGTLDPNATGLMLIALGESRKAMPVLMGLDKEYEGTMKLHGDAGTEEIKKSVESFLGEITQIPPVKSAVARRPRKRNVYDIEVLERTARNVKFRVSCEAGTYIRKLVHDAGQDLGFGAHLLELRRTRIGPFGIDEAVKPDAEEKELYGSMITLEKALERIKLPRITISSKYEGKIRNGSPVRKCFVKSMPEGFADGAYAGIFDPKGRIIALGKFSAMGGMKGDTVAKTDRVFKAYE